MKGVAIVYSHSGSACKVRPVCGGSYRL